MAYRVAIGLPIICLSVLATYHRGGNFPYWQHTPHIDANSSVQSRSLLQATTRVGGDKGTRWRPEILIGYPLTFNPWKLAVFKGTFERVSGWTIKWLELEDPEKAMNILSSGEANLVVGTSMDIARALSRNLDAKIVWIQQDLDDSAGLMIHKRFHVEGPPSDDNPGISVPQDLKGKRIAAYWGSVQHYALIRFLEQYAIPFIEANSFEYSTYKYRKENGLVPVYYDHDPDQTLLLAMEPAQIREAWAAGTIHGAWVGFPDMYEFLKDGFSMITNRELSSWQMVTFDAIVIDAGWAANPPAPPGKSMDVDSFMRTFISELAKSNFYYVNNTKEFQMQHRVTKGVLETPQLRVDGEIAGVIGSTYDKTWWHISAYKYVTIEEHISCAWLGCGVHSRVAWALRDQSQFLRTISYGWGVGHDKRGLEDGTVQSIEFYASRLEVALLANLHANGVDGSYELSIGDEVEFGYHDNYAD